MHQRSDWQRVLLGDVVRPTTIREIPPATTELPFIGMEHVASGTGAVEGLPSARGILSASPRVRQGDVLYGRLRPYLNKVTLAPMEAYASGEFIVFRDTPEIDGSFLRWRLAAQDFVKFACSLNAGDRPRVKWPQMAAFPLLLPSLPAQRQIVELVEDHLSGIGRAVAGLNATQTRLDVLERALHQRALRGLLLRDDLSEGVGGDLVSRAQLLDPSTLDERVWGVPSTWVWVRLGDVFKVAVGTTPSRADPSLWDGSIPWVSSGEVAFNRVRSTKESISAPSVSNLQRRVHPPGTVMLAMIGEGKTRGQAAILDIHAAHNQNCASIRVSETPILPEYVYAFLKERYLETRRGSSGGNQPALNKRRIESIPIPVPPLGTQRRIVEELDAMAITTSYVRQACSAGLSRAAALRRAILAAAFEGRLTGRHADMEVIEELADVQR